MDGGRSKQMGGGSSWGLQIAGGSYEQDVDGMNGKWGIRGKIEKRYGRMAGGDWAGRRGRGGESRELAGARTVGENGREGLDGKPGRGVEEVREIGATGRVRGGAGAGGGAGEWPEMEVEVERMAVRRSGGGGGGGLRTAASRRWGEEPWPGQGVAAVVTAAAAAGAVGLLPRPSLSSHLRGRSLLSFFK